MAISTNTKLVVVTTITKSTTISMKKTFLDATNQPKEPMQHISCLCLKEPRTEFHEHREFQDQTGFESSPENIDHFWQLSESYEKIELIGLWVNVQCAY